MNDSRRQLGTPSSPRRRSEHDSGHRATRAALWAPLAGLALAACAAQQPAPKAYPTLGAEHPLLEKVYDVGANAFISPHELLAKLADKRFVLLGEKHDNARHHVLQAGIIAALAQERTDLAVGMEMLTVEQSAGITAWRESQPVDGAGLGEAVHWGKSGWPGWWMYQPIGDAVAKAGLPLVATTHSRKTLKKYFSVADGFLETEEAKALGVHAPLPEDAVQALRVTVQESHCNMAPPAMVEPMILIQQIKDAFMAQSLLAGTSAEAPEQGGVLIAGGEHARKDRGVGYFLRGAGVGADAIASVAFREVLDERTLGTDYMSSDVKAFDYVWFTLRLSDVDPCEEFREQLEKMGGHD